MPDATTLFSHPSVATTDTLQLPWMLAMQPPPMSRPSGMPGTQAPSGPAPSAGPGGMGAILQSALPFIVLAGVFLFVLRPQTKEREAQETFRKSLQKGDEVVTSGGLIGRVVAIDDQVVTLETTERMRLRVTRESIARKFTVAVAVATPATPADARK